MTTDPKACFLCDKPGADFVFNSLVTDPSGRTFMLSVDLHLDCWAEFDDDQAVITAVIAKAEELNAEEENNRT